MAINNVNFFIAFLCVVVTVSAQLPQFPVPFLPSPGMPGLPDMTKCLSTLMDIPDCIAEISQSILTGKFGNIGHACCKAFLEAEANCVPKVPFIPFLPPMLKEQCLKIVGAIPPTTK